MVPDEEIDALFLADGRSPPGWDLFWGAYPDARGIINVSFPVYSVDRARAIVFVDYNCELLCGSGYYVVLRRRDTGRWEITRTEGTWIA